MKQITVSYTESQEKNPRRTFEEELDHLETRLQENAPTENLIDAWERLRQRERGETL